MIILIYFNFYLMAIPVIPAPPSPLQFSDLIIHPLISIELFNGMSESGYGSVHVIGTPSPSGRQTAFISSKSDVLNLGENIILRP